ncbi:MAG: hypothetical protein AVDCRST_MAG68-105 [uncultured Gemmatimonadetes bacterium]|uniref:NmrA-like domain-containing protein n=1 Tax=uncultured Gemmatimonadota bacterium TaxID=203437 RepID=A0A6J4K887_9BACT|nr:MAG: hypothetical protein AVDCRST_MAG68-105 [uncultured Gemmatimonadota bacterium]
MQHLILGGTGTAGGAVARELLARGESVRILTRTPEKARGLPQGAEPAVGDLRDPGCYHRVFSGFDTLFLLNGVSETELQEGLAGVNEARRAGAARIVYLSVHDAEKGPHIPHIASKLAIEEAIRRSGIPYTILRPNNFYQNDYWFRDAIVEHGVYPQPIGDAGISRVDVRDIAEAGANALTRSGFENRSFALVGPEPLTGAECARAYSEVFGREVRYAGNDLQAWAREAGKMLPPWMVYDFALMYALFQDRGLHASAEQVAETERIVGHLPRAFGDFVQETATVWTRVAAGVG